jgi:hypothetical protein
MSHAGFFPHPEHAVKVDDGEAGFCFHPVHDVDLGLDQALTTVDTEELAFLWSLDPGAGGTCFHPEHEMDLFLHQCLSAIDAIELERCR